MAVLSARRPPKLAGVPETLLIPLWARAVEQSHPEPLIVDPYAAGMVEQLDYDFSVFKEKRVAVENFCVRSRVIDELVTRILEQHPGTPVVEFGAGLDTRFQRVGDRAAAWLEVDFPEVIALRHHFFGDAPARRAIGGSMFDPAWIECCRVSDTPPLIIAEGVFYFFSHARIGSLIRMIGDRLPGASLVFDAVSPLWLKLSQLRHPLDDSQLQFALRPGARELTRWDARWSITEYIGFGDSPWYDPLLRRCSWWKRAAVRYLPPARHAFMVVQASASRNLSQEAS